MARRQQPTGPEEVNLDLLTSALMAVGPGSVPSPEDKLELLRAHRGVSEETSRAVDRFLLEQISRMSQGLFEARKSQSELRGLLERLTQPPLFPAILLASMPSDKGPAALVRHENARRVVLVGDDVDIGELALGDEVLLAAQLNVIVGRSPYPPPRCGETAVFDRLLPDGRLVVTSRDDEVVVDAARQLESAGLKSGDHLRWDRSLLLAYEKVDRSKGTAFFLEEAPEESWEAIGGLDRQIEELQRTILLHLRHMDVVSKYKLRPKRSVLLVGPPGTGKTMIARAFAFWLGKLSEAGRSRFINVKPASLHSMWYGKNEENYREVFRAAREMGEQEPAVPVVIFFDEVDSIGHARGESFHRIDDKVVTAFAAELNGLESRGNILVVSATNRRDTLDPALDRPGRLSDLVLEIPRPNRSAAREILARYLPPDIPYATNGHGPDHSAAARSEIVEAALARIYAPNGESDLATITFRDSKQRAVRCTDLISGAMLENIVTTAIQTASQREIETGESGVRVRDVIEAVEGRFVSEARALTPGNIRRHLTDLPQDADVVRVEPLRRSVTRPQRYLTVV